MSLQEKTLTGMVDELLKDLSTDKGVRLDKDKLEFLRLISRTKYSGLTTKDLMLMLNILKDKNEAWFNEIIEDGLAEQLQYQSPNKKIRQVLEGWFITQNGRKIVKEVINKM